MSEDAEHCSVRYGQSAEDGTLPLLECCVGPAKNGEFFEPSLGMRMKGPPRPFPLEAICTNAASRKVLWAESEKALGAWAL